MVTVRLRPGQLPKLMAVAGIDTFAELARRMDEAERRPPGTPANDPGNLSRIVNGKTQPTARFIATLLTVFPSLQFDDLFEVIEDD